MEPGGRRKSEFGGRVRGSGGNGKEKRELVSRSKSRGKVRDERHDDESLHKCGVTPHAARRGVESAVPARRAGLTVSRANESCTFCSSSTWCRYSELRTTYFHIFIFSYSRICRSQPQMSRNYFASPRQAGTLLQGRIGARM